MSQRKGPVFPLSCWDFDEYSDFALARIPVTSLPMSDFLRRHHMDNAMFGYSAVRNAEKRKAVSLGDYRRSRFRH